MQKTQFTSKGYQSPFQVTSPHLMVYRPQLTSMLSISHRITGVAFLISLWLVVVAVSLALLMPQVWQSVASVTPNFVFVLVLLGLSASAIYHLLNGIRHLCWDWLLGLNIEQVYFSGKVVLFLFVVLLAAFCLIAFT